MAALAPSLALLALLSAPPSEPELEPAPALDPAPQAEISEPSTEPPGSEGPPAGGFGSVDAVETTSNVHAPPPPPEEDSDGGEGEQGPRREMSALIEAGYAQTNLRNAEGLDHHGLFLRVHFVFYPWIAKGRRVAGGLGAIYSYQGVNRSSLPTTIELDDSEAQQQEIMLSFDLLLRPHPTWFSIQPSGMIGVGFYSNAKVFAADRPATIPGDEYAFVVGGSLALCTAWDIACVVGGSELLVDIRTFAIDTLRPSQVIDPWGWHVGVGFDILRVLARVNRVDP